MAFSFLSLACVCLPTGFRLPSTRFYTGPDLSEDGVELTDFSVEGPETPQVGDTLIVRFTLRNTTGSEMKLAPYGILVGCRDPEGENRDFGHREVTLKPEQAYDFEASTVVDKPDLWQVLAGLLSGPLGAL